MKKCLIPIFLVLVGASYAQPPRIDSILVSGPDSDTLQIHGKFGASKGKVILDTADMVIYDWSDSIVLINLPGIFANVDGTCGPVSVVVNGSQSNTRILSKGVFNERIWNDSEFNHSTYVTYYWRYDFHSFFINHKGTAKLIVPTNDINYKLAYDFVRGSANIKSTTLLLSENYFLPGQGSYQFTSGPYPRGDYTIFEYCDAPIDARVAFKQSLSVVTPERSEVLLSCYPNPCLKELNICYSMPQRKIVRLILYDLEGRIIGESMNAAEPGEHSVKWDVSQFPSGSYVLGLVTERETRSQIVNIVH